MPVPRYRRYAIQDHLPKWDDANVAIAASLPLVGCLPILPYLVSRHTHGRPSNEPRHDGLIGIDLPANLGL